MECHGPLRRSEAFWCQFHVEISPSAGTFAARPSSAIGPTVDGGTLGPALLVLGTRSGVSNGPFRQEDLVGRLLGNYAFLVAWRERESLDWAVTRPFAVDPCRCPASRSRETLRDSVIRTARVAVSATVGRDTVLRCYVHAKFEFGCCYRGRKA